MYKRRQAKGIDGGGPRRRAGGGGRWGREKIEVRGKKGKGREGQGRVIGDERGRQVWKEKKEKENQIKKHQISDNNCSGGDHDPERASRR